MATATLVVRCGCGWEVAGSEDAVVPATEEHGLRVHNMRATRDEILGMAVRPTPHAEHYDNGAVKLTGFHLDGEMHGPWSFYRRDGSLMRTGAFDRGKQLGTWRTYDRSGTVVKETSFD
jgi:predicted small metal-binding protein